MLGIREVPLKDDMSWVVVAHALRPITQEAEAEDL